MDVWQQHLEHTLGDVVWKEKTSTYNKASIKVIKSALYAHFLGASGKGYFE